MGDTEILALIAEARKYTLLSIVTRLADALEQMRRERDEAVILRDEHYVVAKSQNDRAEAAEQRVAELREALGVLLETSANPGHAFAHEGNVTTSRALHALGCPGCALESARTAARATLERNPR